MKLDSDNDVKNYLVTTGLSREEMIIEPLSGGVACSVWKIKTGTESWVLKQALKN